MEDTKSLVTIFLQKIFHDRQHIIDTTYKLIYDYNKGERKKTDYEKTLKSICNQLGKEIPNQVLVYLLTLVDMPLDLAESDDTQLKPVIEKIKTLEEIQKTQSCLADSIKPHLEECVASKSEEKKEEPELKEEISIPKASEKSKLKADQKPVPKPSKNKRKILDKTDDLKQSKSNTIQSLLDLAAVSVIKNQKKLKKVYQKKFDKAWKLINSNQCNKEALEKCYDTLRDLNKKRKLLRDIENDNITEEMLGELYQDVDIFLKEKHMYEAVNMDLFDFVGNMFNTK